MQTLITILLLALAVLYLGRVLWRRFTAKGPCGADCGCKQDIRLKFKRR